jgi:acyl-CoA carboxylase subunit alpha
MTKLLIANRGEIARRIIRTCRRLGIATVAVYSEPDAQAPFVREADEAVPLGGASAAESYLRGDAIIAAALRAGADAVHPGYGFLAERASFAQAVIDAGLIWVGPPPAAIEAMGSKVEARERMQRAGVPVLPGERIENGGASTTIAGLAETIGYPLLVKASAGGGGKGMRIVEDPARLADAAEAAAREALSAFGDATVFLERYLVAPRHVEIQIFGDTQGTVVALHERECSIQRRHQKIVEECPSPAVDADLRARMSAAAVAAGQAIGYVGAGTVEFLLVGGEFFFLEVNTRLQVEHPVTELVTGLDLVELQIRVAEGGSLPPEAIEPRLDGHAIEARLYAEDAEHDFLPQVGRLTRFRFDPTHPAVRLDTGVEAGSEVTVHYDPMLAKVIAHAPTRAQAARELAAALSTAEIHGVTTNRDLLVRVLRHPAFLSGETDTHFLERHDLAALAAPLADAAAERLHAAAAALAAQAERRSRARVLGTLPSGWRNLPSQLQEVAFEGRQGEIRVGYRFDRSGGLARLEVGGEPLDGARLRACEPDEVDLEAGGLRRRYRVRRAGAVAWVDSAAGATRLVEQPRYPQLGAGLAQGSLISPMPGVVIRVDAAAGDTVDQGQRLLVIEAMKMEHEIVAPAGGTLSALPVAVGQQVDAGTVLAEIEPA